MFETLSLKYHVIIVGTETSASHDIVASTAAGVVPSLSNVQQQDNGDDKMLTMKKSAFLQEFDEVCVYVCVYIYLFLFF
jgi:hypothetical protein